MAQLGERLLEAGSGWDGNAVDTGKPDESDSLRAQLQHAVATAAALESHLRHALIFRAMSSNQIDSYIRLLKSEVEL